MSFEHWIAAFYRSRTRPILIEMRVATGKGSMWMSCVIASLLIFMSWAWLPFGLEHFDQGYVLSAANFLLSHPEDVVAQKTGGMWLTLLPIALLFELGGDYGLLMARLATIPVAIATTAMGCVLIRRRLSLPMIVAIGGFTHLIGRSWRVDGFLSYPLLSAFGYALAASLLVEGSERRSKWLLGAAGAALGANIFVRLPNLAGLCLAGLPLAFQLLSDRDWQAAARQTGWVLVGIVIGVASVLAAMGLFGHGTYYVEALSALFSMAGSEDSPYNTGWLLIETVADIALALVLTLQILVLAKLADALASLFASRILSVILAAGVGLFSGIVILGDIRTAISLPYGVTLLTLAWSLTRRTGSPRDRIIDLAALLVFLLTPFGAAAGIRSGAAVGFLFAGPVAASRIIQALIASPIGARDDSASVTPRRRRWPGFGIRPVSAGVVALTIFVNALVRLPETSRDTSGPGAPSAQMQQRRLAGIYMDPESAQLYDEIIVAVDEHVGKDEFILAFPHVPVIHYLTNRRAVLTETWPSLRSTKFLNDRLESIRREGGELPVVVRARSRLDWRWPSKNTTARTRWVYRPRPWLVLHNNRLLNLRNELVRLMGYEPLLEVQRKMITKNVKILSKFVQRNTYRTVYQNANRRFRILRPPTEP
jgi:hypothetical protein